MSSQPLFSNLQCTLNALTATNKLNQSSPNIIDCWKLQRWESITIRHICMWPEHFWNEQHMSVDESALEPALPWEERSRAGGWNRLNIQTYQPLYCSSRAGTHTGSGISSPHFSCTVHNSFYWSEPSAQYFKWSRRRVMRDSVVVCAMCCRNCSFRRSGSNAEIRRSEPAF